jgi:hypothetical protein
LRASGKSFTSSIVPTRISTLSNSAHVKSIVLI